jgi:hypothetical protein
MHRGKKVTPLQSCTHHTAPRCFAGFTAIIELEQLQAIASGSASATVGLPAWDEFKADLQEGKISFPSVRSPFLFAGETNALVFVESSFTLRAWHAAMSMISVNSRG